MPVISSMPSVPVQNFTVVAYSSQGEKTTGAVPKGAEKLRTNIISDSSTDRLAVGAEKMRQQNAVKQAVFKYYGKAMAEFAFKAVESGALNHHLDDVRLGLLEVNAIITKSGKNGGLEDVRIGLAKLQREELNAKLEVLNALKNWLG
jgi:hypothetical protein